MSNRLTLTVVGLALAASAFSAPISPEEALERAAISGPSRIMSAYGSGYGLAYTARLEDGVASAYIFTPSDGKGYTILSADDTAVPVLGYSDTGAVDVNNLPPSLVWWLNEQGRKIKYMQAKGIDGSSVRPYAPADLSPLMPLLKTTWNQDAPYNGQTPVISGTQTPTGCVATSFAQVMKYFNYPERGQGSIRYMDSSGRSRTMNFNKEFEWDQMLDNYIAGNYTQEQGDAVAFLMKACGYSVEMNYGMYASGAVSMKLPNAAITYFKYDEATYYTERELYSLDQWTRLIYDNIKNVGPVIYDGSSVDGGHSFVCDGYDGNGYFHFNWGWGGMSDGYYVLDSLNPESQGIGGADGGFNYSQGIILGLQPPTGKPAERRLSNMIVYGNATASLSGDNIRFKAVDSTHPGWGNASYRDIDVSIGAIFTKIGESDPVAEVNGVMMNSAGNSFSSVTLSTTSYCPTSSMNPSIPVPALPDGQYKVTLATKDNEVADAPLQPMVCHWGGVNYCYLTVEGGDLTVSSASPSVLLFENCDIASPLYLGRNAKLVSSIKNDSDIQLSICFSPVLYRSGVIQYQGDMMLATVNPGETLDKSALVAFRAADNATDTGAGTYELKIINRADNQIIGSFGEYELSYVSGTTQVALDELAILDAPQESVTSGSRTFDNTYKVNDSGKFDLNFKYTVTQGYLDTSVRIIGARYNPETSKFEPFENDLYYDLPFLGEDSESSLIIPLDFSAMPAGYVYRISAAYLNNGSNKLLGSIYMTFNSGSGVNGIENDPATNEILYFNLQGVSVDNPQPGQILIRKSGTKTEKIRF